MLRAIEMHETHPAAPAMRLVATSLQVKWQESAMRHDMSACCAARHLLRNARTNTPPLMLGSLVALQRRGRAATTRASLHSRDWQHLGAIRVIWFIVCLSSAQARGGRGHALRARYVSARRPRRQAYRSCSSRVEGVEPCQGRLDQRQERAHPRRARPPCPRQERARVPQSAFL